MSLKSKLVSAVIALALISALLITGVFALKSTDFSVGGSIVFNAKGIEAQIELGVNGLQNGSLREGTIGEDKLKTIVLDSSMGQDDLDELFSYWSDLKLQFDTENGAPVTLQIKITNIAQSDADNYLEINASTDKGDANNCSLDVVSDLDSTAYSASRTCILSPGDSASFTTTFTVENTDVSASLDDFKINFDMQVRKEEEFEDASTIYDYMTFSPIKTDSTNLKVKQTSDTSLPTSLVIPDFVMYNGKACKVVQIDSGRGPSTGAFDNTFTSLTLPNTITDVGSSAFYGNSLLSEVNYLGDINQWSEIYFGNEQANPIYYTKSLKINGVEVTNIVIDKATIINRSAFNGFEKLKSVTIGSQVEKIADSAFTGCSGLEEINYLGDINDWVSLPIGDYGGNPVYHSSCKSLKINGTEIINVVIDKAKTIGRNSFYNCNKITSVKIGKQVKSIGTYAFEGCSALVTAYIDSSLVVEQLTSNSSCGYILSSLKTLYIADEAVSSVPGYVTGTAGFTKGASENGYTVYTRP